MPDPVKEEFPGWLAEALQCPTCREPCALSRSGGMVCLAAPAHTGLIRRCDMTDKVVAAYKLALARNLTSWSQAKAVVMGRKYLKTQLLWRSKR